MASDRSTWQVSRCRRPVEACAPCWPATFRPRHYRYRLEGELSAWKLELEPLDKGAAAAVGASISRIESAVVANRDQEARAPDQFRLSPGPAQ